MRFYQYKGRGGGAADGGGGDCLVQGEDASLHGAQDGSVQARIAENVDREDSEVRVEGGGQGHGLPPAKSDVGNLLDGLLDLCLRSGIRILEVLYIIAFVCRGV